MKKINRLTSQQHWLFHSFCLVGLITLMCLMFQVQHVQAEAEAETNVQMYKVKRGDTIWGIAQLYKLEVKELMSINQLNSHLIQIGQYLKIPAYSEDSERYIVQRGDTLWKIAHRFNVDIHTLQQVNKLETDLLQISQILIIPKDMSEEEQNNNQKLLGFNHLLVEFVHPRWWVLGNREIYRMIDSLAEIPALALSDTPTSGEKEFPDKKSKLKVANLSSLATEENNASDVSDDDLEWLAKIIEAEAQGEPYLGKVAVGSVVMNRVEDDWFPDSIREVIFQKTKKVYQFTPVANGRIYRVTPSEDSYKAAKAALNGEDPTNGALYFYNAKISNDRWIRTRTVAVEIGQHKFAY